MFTRHVHDYADLVAQPRLALQCCATRPRPPPQMISIGYHILAHARSEYYISFLIIIMKRFMLSISIVAWLVAIATLCINNIECPPAQTFLNVFFGVITAFITWIIIFQVMDMRKA